MTTIISVLTLVFVLHILTPRVTLYNLMCPSVAHWNIRAKVMCNSTLKYVCLYNNVKEIYVEGCYGPDWDRKGSKRIFSGSLTRGNCTENRYQPVIFETNGSMSDCVLQKSICSEEGQVAYKNDSTKDDRSCQCDFKKNYSFIKSPKNHSFCKPSEEDCSCYIKPCLVNYTLSLDNKCIESGFQNETSYKKRSGLRESSVSREQVKMENTNVVLSEPTLKINREMSRAAIILTIFCAVTITITVFISKLTIDEGCRICEKGNLSVEEINYLRLVRLLFKVAHPVVRTIFDNVIEPNQLRTTLDRCKTLLEKQYRDKKNDINDFQWNLLYDPLQGKTVTSKDFDIRLMLLLLRTLANFEISDVYEDKSDKSTFAILSRIKHVRNEITKRFAGKLSKSLFNQYRDDISQTLQETKDTEHGQAETQQIDCFGVRGVQKAKDFKLPVPTIEENYFLVVFHIIARIVYPCLQNVYNTAIPLENNKTEQHQTHCSDEESKNLYIRMMLDTLIKSAKQNGQIDRLLHLDVIKTIQREIVQSCSGVLTETRFHEMLKSMREAVLYLGGTFSEEKLLELQKIKNILE